MKFTIVFTPALVAIALASLNQAKSPKSSRHDPPHTRLPPIVGYAFTREALDLSNMLADSTQLDELHRRTRIPRTFGPSGKTSGSSDLPDGPTQLVELKEEHYRFTRRPRTIPPRDGEASDFTDLPVDVTQSVGLHRFSRRPRTVPPRENAASDSTDLPVEATQPIELHRFTRRSQTLPPRGGGASDSTDLPVEATQPIGLHRFSRRPRTIPPMQQVSDSFADRIKITFGSLKEKLLRRTRSPRPTLPPVVGPLTDPTQFAPNQAVVVSVVPQGHTSDAPDATVETVSVAA